MKQKTWLDDYVLAVWKYATSDQADPYTKTLARKARGPAAFAVNFARALGLKSAEYFGEGGADLIQKANEARARGDFFGLMAAAGSHNNMVIGSFLGFLVPGALDLQRYGAMSGHSVETHYLSVSPEVAQDLFGHAAPDVPFLGGLFPSGTVAYLDFEGCGIRFDELHELVAIVVRYQDYGPKGNAFGESGDELDFNVILRHPETNDPQGVVIIYGDVRDPAGPSGISFGLSGYGLAEQAQRNAYELFKNAWLLYLERKDTLALANPVITRGKLETTGRADAQVARLRDEFSLFTMRRLATRERLVPESCRHVEPDGTRRLDFRFQVRGHFRWQPHGPGRELRRLQWIDPYLKGPADAPVRVPLYRVDSMKEVS